MHYNVTIQCYRDCPRFDRNASCGQLAHNVIKFNLIVMYSEQCNVMYYVQERRGPPCATSWPTDTAASGPSSGATLSSTGTSQCKVSIVYVGTHSYIHFVLQRASQPPGGQGVAGGQKH